MKNNSIAFYFYGVIFLLLVWAVVPFSASGADLHGSVAVRGEYDDNIFLRAEDELDDYRTIISPGASAALEKGRNSLTLRYSSELIYHDKYPGQDTFDHAFSVLGESDPDQKISLALDATDNYRFFLINPAQTDRPVLTEDLAKGNMLRVTPSLRWRLGPDSRAIFEYQYTDTFYEDYPEGVDSEGHKGAFTWEEEFIKKVTLSLGYSYFAQRFNRPLEQQFVGASGYDDQQARAGLRWRFSSEFSAGVSYGYVWREYDTDDRIEFSDWNADIVFQLAKQTTLKAEYRQGFFDDVYGRSYENRLASLKFSQGIGKWLKASLGGAYQRLDYRELDDESEVWEGDAGLDITMLSKLSLRLKGSYQEWTSEPEDIVQKLYIAESTLIYKVLDWLSFDLRYGHLENVSDIKTLEYTCNRYSVAATATF
jgi:hypothetical protein